MSDNNIIQMEVEKHSLLPNRYYLILRPNDDGFQAVVYDTTGGLEDEEGQPHPGEVAIEGLLTMLNIEPEKVFTAGIIAMETRARFGEEEAAAPDDDNIIKVDFGPEQ